MGVKFSVLGRDVSGPSKSEIWRNLRAGYSPVVFLKISFKTFCIFCRCPPLSAFMSMPLALVFYENLFPGSKLVNRLQDLGYRVSTTHAAADLLTQAKKEKAMFVVADLSSQSARLIQVIGDLRRDEATAHIPVLGYLGKNTIHLQPEASKAGVSLIADETGILDQLPQLLEHILAV